MRLPTPATVFACISLAACSGQIGGGPSDGRLSDDPNSAGNGGDGGVLTVEEGGPFLASESVARRLTRRELDNTLRDLLGEATAPAQQLLPEDAYAPYDNEYTQQAASGALIDALSVMASDVAAHVLDDPQLRDVIVPCTPSGPGDADCFRTVVQDLGGRTLRRPLTDDEVTAYMGLLTFATEDNAEVDNDFYTAVELLIRALLQDPEFLYRIEQGSTAPEDEDRVFVLNGHEIATRLSYLLWGTTPDDALLAEAEGDALLGAEGRRAVAERMLEDDRARRQVHRFHAMWLGYRAVPHGPELAAAFAQETTALLDRVIFEQDSSYLEVFTHGETYLDDFLASHYELPAPEGGLGWVDYGDSGRAGLLSHGSLLASFGKFSDTSPTQRGIMIRTRLMCEELEPPPANVNADEPPGDMDAVCKYDRYAEHRSSGACAGCHGQMDPIGFGLENYDLAGRFRDHDDGLPECVIDGQGTLPPYGDFSGPAELGRLLVDEGEVEDCVVRQMFDFAVGRRAHDAEEEAIESLLGDFQDSGYSLRQLLLDYVAADAFGRRIEPRLQEAP